MLALASDRGSAQAITPVAATLQAMQQVSVEVLAPPEVHDLFTATDAVIHAIAAPPSGDVLATVCSHLDRWQPRLLLSGSSPRREGSPATVEQAGVLEGRRRGIASFAVLDYWGKYHERFGDRDGLVDLALVPDWIGALDQRCRDDLVRIGIPADRVLLTHNPWLDRVARSAPPASSPILDAGGRRILLVMQPLAPAPAGTSQAFWQDVLDCIVAALASGEDHRHRVIVWRHPAQQRAWFERLVERGRSQVTVIATDDRSDAILAGADALVTVHSTTAYEALHFGTPCVSVRTGIANHPPGWADELALTTVVRSFDALGKFIRSADTAALRAELLARKPRLLREGVFFSDGRATGRVVRHALDILQIPSGGGVQMYSRGDRGADGDMS